MPSFATILVVGLLGLLAVSVTVALIAWIREAPSRRLARIRLEAEVTQLLAEAGLAAERQLTFERATGWHRDSKAHTNALVQLLRTDPGLAVQAVLHDTAYRQLEIDSLGREAVAAVESTFSMAALKGLLVQDTLSEFKLTTGDMSGRTADVSQSLSIILRCADIAWLSDRETEAIAARGAERVRFLCEALHRGKLRSSALGTKIIRRELQQRVATTSLRTVSVPSAWFDTICKDWRGLDEVRQLQAQLSARLASDHNGEGEERPISSGEFAEFITFGTPELFPAFLQAAAAGGSLQWNDGRKVWSFGYGSGGEGFESILESAYPGWRANRDNRRAATKGLVGKRWAERRYWAITGAVIDCDLADVMIEMCEEFLDTRGKGVAAHDVARIVRERAALLPTALLRRLASVDSAYVSVADEDDGQVMVGSHYETHQSEIGTLAQAALAGARAS